MAGLDGLIAGLRPAYQEACTRLLVALGEDSRVRAILVTGSVARGNADPYSDLDLGVIVEADAVAAIAERCVTLLGPLAHCTRIERGPVVILSALTTEALRIDLLVEPVSVATKRRQAPHRILLDQDGLAESLHTADGSTAADPEPLVAEFLRVLGLLDVVLGREEYFVGAQGVMLLRDYLVDLFYIENARGRTTGRKRLNDDLTAEQRTLLSAQPSLSLDSASIIEGHRAAAVAFLPRARTLLAGQDLAWPDALAQTVHDRLRGIVSVSELGLA